MCGQDCQTSLWGGTGISTVGADGGCRCACGDETWSEYNILGLPSCVPSKAHAVFGAVGVFVTMTSLGHAAYQLYRQVKYHRQFMAASTSSVEKCRRWLHIVVIIHAVIGLCYFGMVLLLDSERLWMSTIFMFGIGQIMMTIGGILTVRMWLYCLTSDEQRSPLQLNRFPYVSPLRNHILFLASNDPRLIRETPELLMISEALERPTGLFVSNTVMCVGPAVATVLAAAKSLQAACMVSAVAFLGLIVFCDFIILKTATALLQTVNKYLRNSVVRSEKSNSIMAGTVGSLQLLKAARKNIKFALYFCVVVSLLTFSIVMIGLFTTYGATAPLIFSGIPYGCSPPVWFVFNIQLHAGRSRNRTEPDVVSRASSVIRQVPSVATRIVSRAKGVVFGNERSVVPTLTPTP
ncbi:unnamed protein product [Ectocarpus sp. CCAP 1310/34]|nr:unnamed protein product [Ectocarpus sp. CCAP 1310/34]